MSNRREPTPSTTVDEAKIIHTYARPLSERKRPKRRDYPKFHRSVQQIEPKFRQAIRRIKDGEDPWPLLITGKAGTGKTCAALCLCDYIKTTGFWSLEQACDARMNSEEERRRLEYELLEKELFVIDEVGLRDRPGDLEQTTLKYILDQREYHQYRVFIAISNRTIQELARIYDDPIVSRLTCGTIYRIDGADRRSNNGTI